MLTGHRQREETEVSDALVEEGGYKQLCQDKHSRSRASILLQGLISHGSLSIQRILGTNATGFLQLPTKSLWVFSQARHPVKIRSSFQIPLED